MCKLIIVFLVLTFLSEKAFAQYNTHLKRYKFYVELAQKTSPEAHYILTHLKKPEKNMRYTDDAKTEYGLLRAYGTVVHESCHELNFRMAHDVEMDEGYFIDTGLRIILNKGPVYNAFELNKVVPDSLKKKIFRYPDYIGKRSIVSSQISGIYGMTNEFTAYYQEVLCTKNLQGYLIQKYGFSDPDPWFELYCSPLSSQILAYYEFRLFIAWYIQHAQKQFPEVYQSINSNMELRRAFTIIDNRFGAIAAQFEGDMKSLAESFQSEGRDVRISDDGIQYHNKPGAWHGRGLHFKECQFVKGLVTPELNQILNEFRLGQ